MAAARESVHIRRARPEEAEALTDLILRAKAHWGYDQAFLDACRPSLMLTAADIARNPVYCAEVAGAVTGVCHLYLLSADEAYLDHLFVEPAFIGTGIGALLWRHAVEVAVALGAKTLVLGADPNARPFYERMGAVVVGEIISPLIPGRV